MNDATAITSVALLVAQIVAFGKQAADGPYADLWWVGKTSVIRVCATDVWEGCGEL